MHQMNQKALMLTLTMIGIIYGYQLFNIEDYVCCDGQLHNRTNNSMEFDCYGSNLCNFRTQRCCGNQTLDIEEAENYRCCSTDSYRQDVFYNFRTQICCNGKVIDLPTNFSQISNTSSVKEVLYFCCKSEIYNPSVNACCAGKVIPKEEGIECCGEQKFNVTSEMCCTEHRWMNESLSRVSVVPFDPRNPFCCGWHAYNSDEKICCKNRAWSYPKNYNKKYNRVQCCGDKPLFDFQRYICCNEKLYRKPDHNFHCCGRQLYNYRNQTCCGNRIFNILPNKYIKCCRNAKQLYDNRDQVCCDNNLVLNITDEDKFENRIHCC